MLKYAILHASLKTKIANFYFSYSNQYRTHCPGA